MLFYSVDFKAPRGLWNPLSIAVPGKFHGFGGHSNCNVLIEPIFTDLGHGIHRSRAWHFLLIFNTVGAVYNFYSTFDSIVSPGSNAHCRVDCIIQMINSWTGVIMYMMTCGELIGHRWISPHKGQWRRALMFSLIWAWIKGWVNNGDAGDLRRHHAH